RIVERLGWTFPNFQFIVTTHEPLCLRGLGEGEICVMKRVKSKVIGEDPAISPADLRVDQLLTSELFGLQSTIDPEIDDKFYNYYRLLEDGESSDPAKAKLLEKLRLELSRYNTLG